MMIYDKEKTVATENNAMKCGISQDRLMENAGSTVARVMRDSIIDVHSKHVVVVCGRGNNGGDGFVVARKLYQDGANVEVILAQGKPKSDAADKMMQFASDMGVPIIDYEINPVECREIIESADVVVDALFGFGFHGEVSGVPAEIIDIINNSGTTVYSVDIPSGAVCDSGIVSKHTVKADTTVTFISYKVCHVLYPSADYCGKVVRTDIGIPQSCYVPFSFSTTEFDYIKSVVPKRKEDSHKGSYGKALFVCGSYGMTGAAEISLNAAMHSGLGLAYAAVSDKVYEILAAKLTEPVFRVFPQCNGRYDLSECDANRIGRLCEDMNAVLFGCGCGKGKAVGAILESILGAAKCPVVIDADGINALAANIDLLRNAVSEIVLTPHYGEMARLCNTTVDEIMNDRIRYGTQLATDYGVVLVLKGAHTLVFSPDGSVFANMNGNDGMATAGTGDMLAGIITSLLAQGVNTLDAARLGVFIHGLCGDITADEKSRYSMTVTDMLDSLYKVFLQFD